MLRVHLYPSDCTESVNENMDAAGFSNVSKDTLGVKLGELMLESWDERGVGGDRIWPSSDSGDSTGDWDREVELRLRAERNGGGLEWSDMVY